MPTGIELRPVYYAQQLNDVLWRIIHILKAFRPESIEQLKSKSLCYHRDGKIDICNNPCSDSINEWCLMAFYEYVEDSNGKVSNVGLNYESIIQFADSLVAEGPFDEEMLDKFYVVSTIRSGDNFNGITDPFVEQKYHLECWWTEYAKIRTEVSVLCYNIGSELNWTPRFRGLLKDKILETVFDLPHYMPERFNEYKKECQSTFRDLCDAGGLNALSERNKHICLLSEPHLRRLFIGKTDLFTESTIEDLLLYIIAINYNFEFWTY